MKRGQARPIPVAFCVALMAGTAGCTASPRYPISLGQPAGEGGVIPWQPRYAVSAHDAARNARDRADGDAIAPQGQAYAPPVHAYPPPPAPGYAPMPPSAADADDLPQAVRAAPVDSSSLPPPSAGGPQARADRFDGATLEFATDRVNPAGRYVAYADGEASFMPGVELAAYHHRRHASAKADDSAASDGAAAKPHLRKRDGVDYVTTVKPGEKLSEVAERLHTSKQALIQLNDLKHPRHVHAGTVLKAPYRYDYQVQKGDTLYTISHRFGQDPDAVAKLNGLKHAEALQPGQSIQLPPDASDQGSRAHAGGEAAPVAAPEKILQAETRHMTRAERRRAAREAAEAETASTAPVSDKTAELDTRHMTRAERRRAAREQAEAEREATAPQTASSETPRTSHRERVASGAEPPATYNPPPPTAVVTPPPAPAAATGSGYASGVSSGTLASAAPTPSASATVATTPYYAGVRPSNPPPASATVASSPASTYRPAAAPSSSGYAAPIPSRVATLNAPTYSSTYSPSLGRTRPVEPALSGGVLTNADITAAGRGHFIWPLRGSILSPFGDKGAGQHNDGVDIAATPGSAVRVAASGEVVYAGNSIPGFGNLVLVKHPGGWVTAYAHLDRIEVRMRDSVAQGQEIGLAGQTGAVDRPLLHFEVRYAAQPTEKARPVDPSLVLPAGG